MINININEIENLIGDAEAIIKEVEPVKEVKEVKEEKEETLDFNVNGNEEVNVTEYLYSLTERNPIEDNTYLTEEQVVKTIVKLEKLKELMKEAKLDIRIVGRYIRVAGDTRKVKDKLKTIDFQYRSSTKEWVFTAGEYIRKPIGKTKNKKEYIYSKYNAIKVED